MPSTIELHRQNFATAHAGRPANIVQLGRARPVLPGVVVTPLRLSDDARTVTYEARMVDDANPSHLRLFGVTVESVSTRANFVHVSSDDRGGFVRWSLTFDAPVFTFTT